MAGFMPVEGVELSPLEVGSRVYRRRRMKSIRSSIFFRGSGSLCAKKRGHYSAKKRGHYSFRLLLSDDPISSTGSYQRNSMRLTASRGRVRLTVAAPPATGTWTSVRTVARSEAASICWRCCGVGVLGDPILTQAA